MNTKTFSLNCCPPTAVKRKPKPKTKMTKRHSRPTKAQNRWKLVSEETLTFNEVKPTSVTADSNVPQKKKQKNRLQDPDVVAKAKAARQRYWERRKQSAEAAMRYQEKHGLKCISARIPEHIVNKFSHICKSNAVCQAEIIARLLLLYIRNNSSPSTK